MHCHKERWTTIEGNHLKFWKSIIFPKQYHKPPGSSFLFLFLPELQAGFYHDRNTPRPSANAFALLLSSLALPWFQLGRRWHLHQLHQWIPWHRKKDTKIWGMASVKHLKWCHHPKSMESIARLFLKMYTGLESEFAFTKYEICVCKKEKICIFYCRYIIQVWIFTNHRINQFEVRSTSQWKRLQWTRDIYIVHLSQGFQTTNPNHKPKNSTSWLTFGRKSNNWTLPVRNWNNINISRNNNQTCLLHTVFT